MNYECRLRAAPAGGTDTLSLASTILQTESRHPYPRIIFLTVEALRTGSGENENASCRWLVR